MGLVANGVGAKLESRFLARDAWVECDRSRSHRALCALAQAMDAPCSLHRTAQASSEVRTRVCHGRNARASASRVSEPRS